MPTLELKAGKSARRAVLLTTGLGVIFGLIFTVPPVSAFRATGAPSLPFSAAAVLFGMLAGHLLSFLIVAYIFHLPTIVVKDASGSSRQILNRTSAHNPLALRLAEEKASLHRLEIERDFRHDATFERKTEQRIIWRELLELELQDNEEQLNRIDRRQFQ